MNCGGIVLPDRRILVVAGHYGSGKTEFCVSLARAAGKDAAIPYPKRALVDLDVVNPYFRSRQKKEMLEAEGVSVYGGIWGSGTTAELPELSASVRAPLEDEDCFTIVDLGGNDSGARILRQFSKYFTSDRHALAVVINGKRPDTSDLPGALAHIASIEASLGLKADLLIGNTHLLRHTDAETVEEGAAFAAEVSAASGIPLGCVCYPSPIVGKEALSSLSSSGVPLFPLGMYMAESWQDV